MFSSNKIISEFDFFDTKKIQFINESESQIIDNIQLLRIKKQNYLII
ncbi:unnamed protein product [Paramecium pentaurelia]|uniref:Uncharacterized protein n=1 Tax=Paramecium pentaurelia TaxID=43138 RepID=A0A8S1Y1S3_9CILI|nr:unnamed protein product [Paramecium pentaurelia]